MSWLRRLIDSRRFKSAVKGLAEDWLPPILLDTRWLNALWFRLVSPGADLDFKRKALHMTEAELVACYVAVQSPRGADWTDLDASQLDFLLANLVPGTLLDAGAGCGLLAVEAARRGHRVTALEMDPGRIEAIGGRARRSGVGVATLVGRLEHLPLRGESFDNVVCAHALEHVRPLHLAIQELLRVARRRLLVIVPAERYYRYTPNYHLHFFGGPESLALALGFKRFHAEVRCRCICYWADVASPRL